MARRMDYRIVFGAPAEKIYSDFTSRDYWETLMDAYRFLTPQSEITKFESNGSGTDIVFKQNLPRMYLPPIARAVMPADMIITREQHFDPYDHDGKRGNGSLPRQHPARAGPLRRQVLPLRSRRGQRAAARQRLQGVHPTRRRCTRGFDPAPHQAAVRRRGGVHRRLDRQAPLAIRGAERSPLYESAAANRTRVCARGGTDPQAPSAPRRADERKRHSTP